jgi:cellulose synthase/poly-beta-1,6-N-acetylglucosamine synthase-like glycosyltransferase
MALWDHVGNGEMNPARPRRDAAHFAWSDGPAFLRGSFGPPRSSNDNQRCVADEGPADELDCLRRVLAPELLRAAEARARELGIGADQVLILWGVIDEEAYLQRLALHTGIAIENFSEIGRGDSLLRDRQFLHAAELGLIRLRRDGRLTLAPRHLAARMLCRLVVAYPEVTEWLRLASSSRLHQFLLHQTDDVLGRTAANGLRRRFPKMSAAPAAVKGPRWRRHLQRFEGPFGVAALMLLPPIIALDVWSVVLALWFLAFIGLRLCGSFLPRLPQPKLRRLPDHQLPVYTVIAALYREAKSVGPLMQAIDAFDYPREKLQVILALEPDDLATRAAIARLGPMPHVQILIASTTGPRTKPKALNCALPFARGSFTAVFDAEDRPDPGQLRAALDAFRNHGTDVACAQASLCIDNNNKDSWLSRTFAAEYAGQFDVFLPGLAAMRMPLPLGGSSNHFRTAVLREVGGWDAWNVTEDADLGLRLARFGYRSVTFDSTTNEEAPIRFKAWLGQRSRWMKGWMQTWRVHMREPRRLWRQAGPRGFLTLNIIVGGNVLTALAYPVLVIELAAYLLTNITGGTSGLFFTGSLAPLHIATITAGFASTVAIGLMGLARRDRLRSGWVLALTPFYWGCLSIAAWRALWQLWRDPYRWEKTEHGLTRSGPSTAAPRAKATAHPTKQRRGFQR